MYVYISVYKGHVLIISFGRSGGLSNYKIS